MSRRLLPQIEAAVYFCRPEALQNAEKYVGAGRVDCPGASLGGEGVLALRLL